MIPSQLTLSMVPVETRELFATTVAWWSVPQLEAPVSVPAGTRVSVAVDVDERNGWRWHGTVGSSPPVAFDQSTWFGSSADRPSSFG